ncbi:MAG: hypothetical protein E7283_00515 [Lachnospiraceae bacterium]|nr:hypothetical protein [Lachnospiraceae bacterium]
MLAVEIVLILIGVAFLVGSYFVEERFSEKDIQEISKMSETQLNMIVDKQVKSAKTQVENSVDEIIDESLAVTKRGLEKETNEKIMAISEYSDTVLESMNKTHNEIMFLYSMLNDKHAEMTEFAGALQKYSKSNKQPQQENVILAEETETVHKVKEQEPVFVVRPNVTRTNIEETLNQMNQEMEGTQESVFLNKNEQILNLHKEGKSDVEIAKALDCGLGEVRLVLGLYKEEHT